jgi:hypothetical protein
VSGLVVQSQKEKGIKLLIAILGPETRRVTADFLFWRGCVLWLDGLGTAHNDKLSASSDGRFMMQVPELRLHGMSFPFRIGAGRHRP